MLDNFVKVEYQEKKIAVLFKLRFKNIRYFSKNSRFFIQDIYFEYNKFLSWFLIKYLIDFYFEHNLNFILIDFLTENFVTFQHRIQNDS